MWGQARPALRPPREDDDEEIALVNSYIEELYFRPRVLNINGVGRW